MFFFAVYFKSWPSHWLCPPDQGSNVVSARGDTHQCKQKLPFLLPYNYSIKRVVIYNYSNVVVAVIPEVIESYCVLKG
jgi:hypothetical protein